MNNDFVLIAMLIIPAGLLLYLPVFIILSLVRKKKRRELGVAGPPWYLATGYLLLFLSLPLTISEEADSFCATAPEVNLSAISYAQSTYKSEHGSYVYGDQFFAPLNCEFMGDNYDYFCGDEMIDNVEGKAGEHRACGIGVESPARAEHARQDWPLTIRPATSATGFTCLAIGNLDRDVFPDVYLVNDSTYPEHVLSDQYNSDAQHLLIPARFGSPQFFRRYYDGVVFCPLLLPSIFELVFLLVLILLVIDERKYWRAKRARTAESEPGDAGG